MTPLYCSKFALRGAAEYITLVCSQRSDRLTHGRDASSKESTAPTPLALVHRRAVSIGSRARWILEVRLSFSSSNLSSSESRCIDRLLSQIGAKTRLLMQPSTRTLIHRLGSVSTAFAVPAIGERTTRGR